MTPASRPISTVMSPCPYFIAPDQSLSAAHGMMRRHRIRHLPVCEDGELVGSISMGDLHLVETLDGVHPDEVTVREAMTGKPYVVMPNARLRDVVHVMADSKIDHVLVSQGSEVVGIFTTIDALRAFSEVLASS